MNEYEAIMKMIERAKKDEIETPYSVVGDTIMADDEKSANVLADFFERFNYMPSTGFYDPEEDKRDNCIDEATGKWYIEIN